MKRHLGRSNDLVVMIALDGGVDTLPWPSLLSKKHLPVLETPVWIRQLFTGEFPATWTECLIGPMPLYLCSINLPFFDGVCSPAACRFVHVGKPFIVQSVSPGRTILDLTSREDSDIKQMKWMADSVS